MHVLRRWQKTLQTVQLQGLTRCAIRVGLTEEGEDSPAAMDVAFKWILMWGGGLSVLLYVVWPLLALPAKVFSKGYFTFWVIISVAWGAPLPSALATTYSSQGLRL